jgi:hypothetical protein
MDDCTNVDAAMAILPNLQKIIHLEVLSTYGIQSVCDKFVMGLCTLFKAEGVIICLLLVSLYKFLL